MLALFARSYMTLFEWFWGYLCPKMAYKMPQVFPTVSLDWLLINYELKELCQLRWGTRVRLSKTGKACVGRVYAAEFTPGVPRLCWKSSHSVFLKTLNFLLVWTSFFAFSFCCVCCPYVWTSFLAFSFRCVCSHYVWTSSPETLDEVPPTWS